MNIPAIATSALNSAFGVVSSVVKTCTYVQRTPSYSTSTGSTTFTEVETPISALGLMLKVREANSEKARFGDEKFLVKAEEMVGITPSLDDVIKQEGFPERAIIDYSLDTTGTLYKFIVRIKKK